MFLQFDLEYDNLVMVFYERSYWTNIRSTGFSGGKQLGVRTTIQLKKLDVLI